MQVWYTLRFHIKCFLCLGHGTITAAFANVLSSGPQTLKRAARKMERNWKKTGMFHISCRESTIAYRNALKRLDLLIFQPLLEENKQNPKYLFEIVAKLTRNKVSSPKVSKQHSNNDFMNFFTYKIDNIREKIINMQPSTTVSHQTVHCSLTEEN